MTLQSLDWLSIALNLSELNYFLEGLWEILLWQGICGAFCGHHRPGWLLAWWLQAFGLILAIWLTLLAAALLLRASAGRLNLMK
jgi:hypothetical protein